MKLVRVPSAGRGPLVEITINGKKTLAHAGETVHAALLAAGHVKLRRSHHRGEPRSIFCGMGVCQECLVTIDGRPGQLACMWPVAAGMEIEVDEG